MDWVHLVLTGGLYMVTAVAVTLLGLIVVRRFIPHLVLSPHNDVAGFVYATIAVTYAVILGFVIVTVWGEFENARDNADREANAVADLYRLAAWFPETTRDEVRTALYAYTQSVVNDEWNAMRENRAPSATTDDALNRLWEVYLIAGFGVSATTDAYDPSLDRLQELGNARRTRLLESTNGLPSIMWIGLLAGAALTVGFAYGFGVERSGSHAIMLGLLAASVALLLFMVFSLNYAFRGDVRVQPDGFELVLNQFPPP